MLVVEILWKSLLLPLTEVRLSFKMVRDFLREMSLNATPPTDMSACDGEVRQKFEDSNFGKKFSAEL